MKGTFLAFVFLLLAIAKSSGSTTRIATVRIKEICATLPEYADIQKEAQEEKQKVAQDPRSDDLRRIIEEMKDLNKQMKAHYNKSKELNHEALEHLNNEFVNKDGQARVLKRDFEIFVAERTKEINRKQIERTREFLKRLWDTTSQIATEQGYDFVIENSGETNSKTPFLLYTKKTDDLTAAVIAALKAPEAKQ